MLVLLLPHVAWAAPAVTRGRGIADVLLRSPDGRVNHDFSGKLSFSWPRNPLQATSADRRGKRAQFPYGYGLSYQDRVNIGASGNL